MKKKLIDRNMAHLAHTIPWRSFASNFEYTTRPHISNIPQLHMTENSNQLRELQHFANVFAKCIREFGASERVKYASAEVYKRRSASWVKSDMGGPDLTIPDPVPEKKNPTREEKRARKKYYSAKESQPERRKVFPNTFKTKYAVAYDNWQAYDIESRQDIQNWLALPDSHAENSCLDTLKIILMEAAAATQPLCERVEGGFAQQFAMETLLLLANKKDISASIQSWKHRGMYSEHYGIETVAEKALDGYLMFNLFVAMRENGSGICELDTGQDWLHDNSGWYGRFMVPRERETLRPRYMNTKVWVDGKYA